MQPSHAFSSRWSCRARNIGGGDSCRAIDGESHALDFRETAPLASRDTDAKGETGDRSVPGHLAAGVPGSVAGLWAVHQKLGSRPWAELVQPAIQLAEEGFEVDTYAAAVIRSEAERLARFPASAALYLSEGRPLAPGTRLKNPDLARTLRRIADGGRDGFYQGETATLILAEMKRGKGMVTARDLEGYEAQWRAPITFQPADTR
jgi:gamma-glutamyltranspeptidase/glutathione hydrolase